MDALAVYSVAKQARDWITAGNGPVLIETLCYRYGPHTTAGDVPRRYRSEDEEDIWLKKDPLIRMRKFLESKGLWDEDQEKACVEAANKEVDDAMQEVESQPTQTVTELMQNEYVVTPPAIQKELDSYQAKEAK